MVFGANLTDCVLSLETLYIIIEHIDDIKSIHSILIVLNHLIDDKLVNILKNKLTRVFKDKSKEYKYLPNGTKHGPYCKIDIFLDKVVGQYNMGKKTGKWIRYLNIESSGVKSLRVRDIDIYKNGSRHGICIEHTIGREDDMFNTYEYGKRQGRCAYFNKQTMTITSAWICDQNRYIRAVPGDDSDIKIFMDALY